MVFVVCVVSILVSCISPDVLWVLYYFNCTFFQEATLKESTANIKIPAELYSL